MKTLLLITAMVAGTAQAADITVLATPAIKEAYAELVPLFEKQTQDKVATTWVGTADLKKRLDGGEVYDAVICASNLLEELTDTGKLMFNVTNQFTFGAIFQREMGSKGDVKRRREVVADIIVSYLTKEEKS